jgi:signal transduction histidine kinase
MKALRSTPLRLTGILIIVFSLFTLAGYAGALLVTRASLTHDVEARIAQTVETLRTIPEQEEVAERAQEIAAAADRHELLLRYDVPGAPAIGNLPEQIVASSGSIVQQADLGLAEDAVSDSYAAWSGNVGAGTLTVLVSRESLVELGETFSTVLLLSLVPALLLATCIGALVARGARDRLEAIRTTLGQLTSGCTEARVPLTGNADDDLGQIALAVNRMAEAQAASTEALRQVSDDIAHDLRTPVQHVALLLERLDGQAVTDAGREIVAAARAETGHIIETFRSLLQIAQIEGGQTRAGFVSVELAALVADVVEVYAWAAEESGHVLRAHIDEPATVVGDRTLLGRLVANLIQNALRHTPPGRIDITLSGGAAPVLTVTDDGPGIPEAERSRVLRRLYRLERSRTSEGSGLGLSLVAAIVELHHARLELEDAEPGLSVRVSFGG